MEDFDDIERQIRTIIAEELQADEKEIRKDSTIAELGGDSLKALMLITSLENHFNITISDEDAMKIKSFSAAAAIVRKLKRA
jgi:acyl carrier protein